MSWSLEELRAELQKPLGDPGPSRPVIVVHSLRDDGAHLVVELDAGPPGGQGRRWELTFASIEGDVKGDAALPEQTPVLVVVVAVLRGVLGAEEVGEDGRDAVGFGAADRVCELAEGGPGGVVVGRVEQG
jgi:hypothetical protein